METYDPRRHHQHLRLLQRSLGELYFQKTYDKDAAITIANFIEQEIDPHNFVREIEWDRIERNSPDNEAKHNRDVCEHLYRVVTDCLTRQDYGPEHVNRLSQYRALAPEFRPLIEKHVLDGDFHCLLSHLDEDEPLILTYLDQNWSRLPDAKQRMLMKSQIKTDQYQSFHSEIDLILHIDDLGMVYEVDVPLHDWEDGEVNGDVDLKVEEMYIEIYTPRKWPRFELSNRVIGIPNRAIDKIQRKFRDKYRGTRELGSEQVFIAIDIGGIEIDAHDVVEALCGKLKGQLMIDQASGKIVDERVYHDGDESLRDEFLIRHLNGVIWYSTRLNSDGSNLEVEVTGGVVPNPECQDDGNTDLCVSIDNQLFGQE